MSKLNFYEILNATPESSVDELRRNYKQLILQCHPDKLPHADKANQHKSSATATNAEIDNTSTVNEVEVDVDAAAVDPKNVDLEMVYTNKDFVDINEAWSTLKDPAKRRLYDAELLLTKFQMHSNIFARLTLDDMKRCAGTTANSGSDSGDSDSDHEKTIHTAVAQSTCNADNEVAAAAEIAKSIKIHWHYTYDCRCGGQYVLDESADSEILDRKRKRTRSRSRSGSGTRSRNRNHNRKQKHSLDNDNDNNCAGGGARIESESVGDSANTVEGGKENYNTIEDHDDGVVDANAHDDDDDGDVMVECSECSLVIVLT